MTDADRLVARLRQKMDQITSEAATHDGCVPPDTLGELERLARLVDVIEKTRPVRRRARWPVALVLVVTLALVSVLLFLRVAETDIELDLVVSEVRFALTQPQVVTAIANLAELRASGLRGIQLPDVARDARTDPALTEAEDSILLTTAGDASRRGSVALAPINAPRGTELRIVGTGSAQACRLVLTGASHAFRVTLDGLVDVAVAQRPARAIQFNAPTSLSMESQRGTVDMDLVFAPGSTSEFAPQLSVEKLALAGFDEFHSLEGSVVRPVSAILSGALYLESLRGAEHRLRQREILRFVDIRGIVRMLRPVSDGIKLNFAGRVRGMHRGWGESSTDLMPTYLEWLQARHALSLLWGTTLYVLGIVAAAARWWGVWP